MRSYRTIVYTAAIALLLSGAACTNDDGANNSAQDNVIAVSDKDDVSFVVQSFGLTRAGETSFDTGDAIGVFASINADGTLYSTDNYADNVKYAYSSSGFIHTGAGIKVPNMDDKAVTYYAVYPFTEQAKPQFTFTINSDQSTYDAYTKSDLMFASAVTSSFTKVVPLKFNHVMSRVLIDGSPLGLSPEGYELEFISYKHSVDVDLQNQTIESKGDFTRIKLCDDGANHFKAILPPQILLSSNVTAELRIGGSSTPISVVVPFNIELKSGYSVSLRLCKKGSTYMLEYAGTIKDDSGIPDDSEATPNPPVDVPTTSIPNIQYTSEVDGDDIIIRIDMTGIQNPETLEWLKLFGTSSPNQNVWVSVDGQPKGFTVMNNKDNSGYNIMTDVIFTVDNSGSMSEEADAVARDIISWSNSLASSGLNVQFACVGYSVSGTINGGIDFTSADGLSAYLNQSTGTSRTMRFAGPNASTLSNAASQFPKVKGECGAMAIRYADAYLNFRPGANRIYVNFTDEPNQPNNNQDYSVEFYKDQSNWNTSQGTVHTVYSGSSFTETLYNYEYPWKISEYTGGTIFKTNSSFSGVDLSSLPVTGAMQNSYVIRFHNIAHLIDGNVHVIKITIYSSDGKVKAERTFYVIFVLP